MNKQRHYTYRITWSKPDNEYVGLCLEFPSLSFLANTRMKALDGIIHLVDEVVADLLRSGEQVPEALAEKQFSGKFQVRIPPEQHRKLAIKAAEMGVSLNRYISSKLLD